MWLFTTFGFFSVEEERPGDDLLSIKSFSAADLDLLRERHLPELGGSTRHEEIGGAKPPYPWHASVRREAFARAVGEIAKSLRYQDFETAVREESGATRACRLSKVRDNLAEIGGAPSGAFAGDPSRPPFRHPDREARPSDDEVERRVLAALLGRRLPLYHAESLAPREFDDPVNGRVFSALLQAGEQGVDGPAAAIRHALELNDDAEAIQRLDDLLLIGESPAASPMLVRERALLRQMANLGSAVLQRGRA